VKLPGHRSALPGEAILFHIVPPSPGLIDLTPGMPVDRDGGRSGKGNRRANSDPSVVNRPRFLYNG